MIDLQQYDRVVDAISRAKFDRAYKQLSDTAEDAWSANKNARRQIDMRNDEVKGEKELVKLRKALQDWKSQLEDLQNAVEKVAKRSAAAVHAGRNYTPPPEDGW